TLPEYCKVAPRRESRRLPKRPPKPATTMMGHCGAATCSTAVSTLAFLPLGTLFLVVMRKGSPVPVTVPNSEAHVSPLQHANVPIYMRKRI
ncbi:hypothetical protein X777_01446, partial [Ooceraea biroi]